MRVTPVVDGVVHELDVDPRRTLAAVLSADHVACADGTCGDCAVLADGAEIRSCLMLAVQSDGMKISTSAEVLKG